MYCSETVVKAAQGALRLVLLLVRFLQLVLPVNRLVHHVDELAFHAEVVGAGFLNAPLPPLLREAEHIVLLLLHLLLRRVGLLLGVKNLFLQRIQLAKFLVQRRLVRENVQLADAVEPLALEQLLRRRLLFSPRPRGNGKDGNQSQQHDEAAASHDGPPHG